MPRSHSRSPVRSAHHYSSRHRQSRTCFDDGQASGSRHSPRRSRSLSIDRRSPPVTVRRHRDDLKSPRRRSESRERRRKHKPSRSRSRDSSMERKRRRCRSRSIPSSSEGSERLSGRRREKSRRERSRSRSKERHKDKKQKKRDRKDRVCIQSFTVIENELNLFIEKERASEHRTLGKIRRYFGRRVSFISSFCQCL